MSKTKDMIKRFHSIAGIEDLDGVFWYKDEIYENATLALYYAVAEHELMSFQAFCDHMIDSNHNFDLMPKNQKELKFQTYVDEAEILKSRFLRDTPLPTDVFVKQQTRLDESFKNLSSQEKALEYTDYLISFKAAFHLRKETIRTAKEKASLARMEISSILNQIQLVDLAKVARASVEIFDGSEVLELLDFFESKSDVQEAINQEHEKLRPRYERLLKSWLYENTSVKDVGEIESDDIKPLVDRCMRQGLTSIQKSEDFSAYFSVEDSSPIDAPSSSHRKIEKSRSWKDISKADTLDDKK